jgi:hypothetical protein
VSVTHDMVEATASSGSLSSSVAVLRPEWSTCTQTVVCYSDNGLLRVDHVKPRTIEKYLELRGGESNLWTQDSSMVVQPFL